MRKFILSVCLGGATFVSLLSCSALQASAEHLKEHSQQWDSRWTPVRDTRPGLGEAYEPLQPAARQTPPPRHSTGRAKQPAAVPPKEAADPPDAPAAALPDRTTVRHGAKRFQDAVQEGRVSLLNSSREGAQLNGLSLDGLYRWPTPPVNPSRSYRTSPDIDSSASSTTEESVPASPVSTTLPSRGAVSSFRFPASRAASRQPALKANQDSAPVTTEAAMTAPPAELFAMLNGLAARSTAQHPLEISSLLRPPYRTSQFQHAGITNPHSLGQAADITAFGGHHVRTAEPEECVQAFLALLRALPPGRYRMGLPKAPYSAPVPALPADAPAAMPPDPSDPRGDRSTTRSSGSLPSRGLRRQDERRLSRSSDTKRKGSSLEAQSDAGDGLSNQPGAVWPFFPPPQADVDAKGKPITRFANEHYADEQFINDERVRQALLNARRRGVDVFAVFPDGVNHIHVDVKQVL